MANLEIGAIARKAGIKASAIRFYEQIGLLKAPDRVNGRRRYEADVLPQLRAIQVAQEAGFTLNEIGTLFSGFSEDTPVSDRWREMAQIKMGEVDALISKAQRMKRVLEEGMRCGCVELEGCLVVLDESAERKPTRGGRGGAWDRDRVCGA
jgi:MerR family transcriptional regulator, redox-sensitive transcriptional activator SoxR